LIATNLPVSAVTPIPDSEITAQRRVTSMRLPSASKAVGRMAAVKEETQK
jgi:hypothetical protein